ncbi:MAG: hypothetical protein BWZ10_02986 [candidate division BRC1 bacterium ADurb.BinA364]|nr:MAG: hypothetical protein BWZ10_02986 [candidate division BRC1 bacterium ADurb.BinA364]
MSRRPFVRVIGIQASARAKVFLVGAEVGQRDEGRCVQRRQGVRGWRVRSGKRGLQGSRGAGAKADGLNDGLGSHALDRKNRIRAFGQQSRLNPFGQFFAVRAEYPGVRGDLRASFLPCGEKGQRVRVAIHMPDFGGNVKGGRGGAKQHGKHCRNTDASHCRLLVRCVRMAASCGAKKQLRESAYCMPRSQSSVRNGEAGSPSLLNRLHSGQEAQA